MDPDKDYAESLTAERNSADLDDCYDCATRTATYNLDEMDVDAPTNYRDAAPTLAPTTRLQLQTPKQPHLNMM